MWKKGQMTQILRLTFENKQITNYVVEGFESTSLRSVFHIKIFKLPLIYEAVYEDETTILINKPKVQPSKSHTIHESIPNMLNNLFAKVNLHEFA